MWPSRSRRVRVMPARAGVIGGEDLVDEVVVGVREAGLGEAHVVGEAGEEAGVGAGFAERGDGGLVDLCEEVAVGALDVLELEEGGRGEDEVGVVGGVGEELLVDDGEEVVAREAAEDVVLVGRDGGGVAVVDEEGVDGRAADAGVGQGERAAELAHVDGARGAAERTG